MQPQMVDVPVISRDLATVDTILDRAIASGNPLIATEHGNTLSNTIVLKGIALAKLFYGLRSNWALFRLAGIDEEFADFIDANMFGIEGGTAVKYADMFESVFVNSNISDELKKQLSRKPIKTLLLLTAAVREGDLSEQELGDVVLKDHKGVHALVRQARGQATSSSTAVYGRLVQRESTTYPQGTIVAFGVAEHEALGLLNLNPTTESGKKFLERMKRLLQLEDLR